MTEREQIDEMAFDLCMIDTCKHLAKEECGKTTCAHCEAEAYIEGEWVKHEHNFWGVYYTCSACKCDVARAKKYQFCPDCGAKMKGGE